MDMDSAAVFLAGSILYAVGLIVILVATVVANNIIHKYWKSFGWKFFPAWTENQVRFVEPQEIDKSKEPKV
jgi:hypothetical protein